MTQNGFMVDMLTSFWFLFPQILGEPSLHRREHSAIAILDLADMWRSFCKKNDIIIIDVYKSIDGILLNHADEAIANPARCSTGLPIRKQLPELSLGYNLWGNGPKSKK